MRLSRMIPLLAFPLCVLSTPAPSKIPAGIPEEVLIEAATEAVTMLLDKWENDPAFRDKLGKGFSTGKQYVADFMKGNFGKFLPSKGAHPSIQKVNADGSSGNTEFEIFRSTGKSAKSCKAKAAKGKLAVAHCGKSMCVSMNAGKVRIHELTNMDDTISYQVPVSSYGDLTQAASWKNVKKIEFSVPPSIERGAAVFDKRCPPAPK